MIKAIAVDDEPLALALVEKYIRQTPFLEFAGGFGGADGALKRIAEGDVELAFTDIQMPGVSGLTLAGTLQNLPNPPMIVFTTAYAEHALEGYKLSVVDYLLKPFDYDEFLRSARKAEYLVGLRHKAEAADSANSGRSDDNNSSEGDTQSTEDYFFVKSEYKLVRIETARIVYIEGLKDYIKIYLDGDAKPVLTLQSLKEMEARLPKSRFVRVHRSYIVNIGMISGTERGAVVTQLGRVPIGDGYRARFAETLQGKTI